MAEIPTQVVTAAEILEWEQTKAELDRLKSKEMLLRTRIFKGFFPNPVEGTNKFPLANHYELKATHVINRSVDIGAFTNMRPLFTENGLRVDDLVKFKPELAKAEYNKLTEEEKHLFDRCLIIKPGSPSLEIFLPAKYKNATVAPGGQENL